VGEYQRVGSPLYLIKKKIMIILVTKITEDNGNYYYCDNVCSLQSNTHVHFDIVDARGNFNCHSSLPIGNVLSIKPSVLQIDL